jgi:hypothetical protein
MTKATPHVVRGLVGCADVMMVRFFSNLACSVAVISSSRWVSWTARIATPSVWIVSLSLFHFSRYDMFSEGELAPFMFRDAILILAFRLFFFFLPFRGWVPWLTLLVPGVGVFCPGWAGIGCLGLGWGSARVGVPAELTVIGAVCVGIFFSRGEVISVVLIHGFYSEGGFTRLFGYVHF